LWHDSGILFGRAKSDDFQQKGFYYKIFNIIKFNNVFNHQATNILMKILLIICVVVICIHPIPFEYYASIYASNNLQILIFTFGKLIWSIAVIGIIFICHYGHGGIINDILSWKLWSPVAKMGLSIYLVTAGIQYIEISLWSEPQSINDAYDLVSRKINSKI
jgi:peptidoglycan/LPS O-acetylase OafA/YrhL